MPSEIVTVLGNPDLGGLLKRRNRNPIVTVPNGPSLNLHHQPSQLRRATTPNNGKPMNRIIFKSLLALVSALSKRSS